MLVFGRRAGIQAAEYAKGIKGKKRSKPTLSHVEKFNKELAKAGVKEPMEGPMVLPDYTPEHVS